MAVRRNTAHSASTRGRAPGSTGPRLGPGIPPRPRREVRRQERIRRRTGSSAWLPFLIAAALLIADGAAGEPQPHPPRHAGVSVETTPLRPAATCGGDFETHRLEHTTRVYGGVPLLFDSHGSGVAAGDLDRDGDADLVLANVAGESSVLWNLGDLRFRRQALAAGPTRAVNLVDLDADGWLDIAFTRQGSIPVWWRNSGDGMHGAAFERAAPLLTPNHAYTMAWADLDGDGDLDLVTGSYDAELVATMGPDGLHGAGVYYHERRSEDLLPTRLATRAEALAILLIDLDGDRRLDILVGNDFAEPDRTWLRRADGWQLGELFSSMSLNTMSLAAGDLDNDGVDEIFSADMKPYTDDPGILEFYGPLPEPRTEAVQVSANALLVRRHGGYDNHAAGAGVDASGWSWAAQFGDLDNDGFLDLYVVNGMMSEELFAHIAAYALVEENQVYRNDGSGSFQPMPEWRLGSIASGRGMVMVRSGRRRRPRHRGQQPAGAGPVVRESAVSRGRRDPGCRALAGRRQHRRHRQPPGAAHQRRRAAPRGYGQLRLPVRQRRGGALRVPAHGRAVAAADPLAGRHDIQRIERPPADTRITITRIP